MINQEPTADVVPRAEVEKIEAAATLYKKTIDQN